MGCYTAAWLAQLNAWVPVSQVGGGTAVGEIPDQTTNQDILRTGKIMMTVIYKISYYCKILS